MHPDTIISRNEEKFMISTLGNEVVLMDIQQGHYININPVGSTIWNKLSAPVSVKNLITSLVEEFSVSPTQCENDTMQFLQKLEQHHMLKIQ
ncbi:PqqD family protein [Chitinophaga sancti]|uniref:PqqD family protein n=1 Tax=Chitinophaga sancti TaxID=1004 RepID=UPI003F7AF717